MNINRFNHGFKNSEFLRVFAQGRSALLEFLFVFVKKQKERLHADRPELLLKHWRGLRPNKNPSKIN